MPEALLVAREGLPVSVAAATGPLRTGGADAAANTVAAPAPAATVAATTAATTAATAAATAAATTAATTATLASPGPGGAAAVDLTARLLALPQAQRERFDLSSLRFVVHGAAPCPVPVKRALIDWFGPVLTEYYAATEGGHGIHVNSQDWLRRPGTVGRMDPALGHRIVGDEGRVLGPGQVGRIFFSAPQTGRFEYHGDAEKTAAAYAGTAGQAGEHFTLGDMGYADEEGWLFLTGRAAECIISGGVNIYPREIDEVLLRHAAVAEACTVGAPDDEWGERVVAVVVPAEGCQPTQQLAAELSAHAAAHLASFKRPREIVFDTALPHTATGKLQRRLVRARFWQGRGREI